MILQSKIYPKQANYKFKTLIYDLFRASLADAGTFLVPFFHCLIVFRSSPVILSISWQLVNFIKYSIFSVQKRHHGNF